MKLTGFLFLLVAVVPTLLAQTDDVSGPRLVLPKVEVKGTVPVLLPENEHWNYFNMGGVEVLASPSVRNARSMLVALQKFRHSLKIIYPAPSLLADQRLSLLLCDEKAFSNFRPAEAPITGTAFSGLVHSAEHSFIIVNLDADSQPDDSAATFNAVDPYRQLNAQYLRYLFNTVNARMPFWLEEGLLQTISDIEFSGQWLVFGKLNTAQNLPDGELGTLDIPDFLAPNVQVSGLAFKQALAHKTMLPLAQFFEAKTPEGLNPSSDSAWAKQAYAFVHFCMFGNKLRYRTPLANFVDRLKSEPLSEELFHGCFGVTYKEMQSQLEGYLLHTSHKYQKYVLKPEQQLAPVVIEFREASTAEVAMIKGEALQAAGRAELALQTYRSVYDRGLRTPDFLAAYANSLNASGDTSRARQLSELAIKGVPSRPSAYVLQARLRLDACLAAPAGADGKLNNRQLISVLEPLFKARNIQPAIPQSYELIAEAWSKSDPRPTTENLLVLDEGIKLFPRETQLLVHSFHLYSAIGDKEKAASIAKLGIRLASEQSTKAIFEELLASASKL